MNRIAILVKMKSYIMINEYIIMFSICSKSVKRKQQYYES